MVQTRAVAISRKNKRLKKGNYDRDRFLWNTPYTAPNEIETFEIW